MGTLSPFTIDVYTITLERELVERRRAAAGQRSLAEMRALAEVRAHEGRPPRPVQGHRPHGPRRLTGAH